MVVPAGTQHQFVNTGPTPLVIFLSTSFPFLNERGTCRTDSNTYRSSTQSIPPPNTTPKPYTRPKKRATKKKIMGKMRRQTGAENQKQKTRRTVLSTRAESIKVIKLLHVHTRPCTSFGSAKSMLPQMTSCISESGISPSGPLRQRLGSSLKHSLFSWNPIYIYYDCCNGAAHDSENSRMPFSCCASSNSCIRTRNPAYLPRFYFGQSFFPRRQQGNPLSFVQSICPLQRHQQCILCTAMFLNFPSCKDQAALRLYIHKYRCQCV